MPKVPRGGAADSVETLREEAERDGFIEVLNALWNKPEPIQDCVGFIRKVLVKPAGSNEWAPPGSLAKLDRDFAVQSMCAHIPKVSAQWFDDLNCRNDAFIHELLSFMTQWPLQTPIPDCAKDERVLVHKAFVSRLKEVDRLAAVAKHVSVGKYDQTSGGAYSLVFTENKMTEIVHCSGARAAPPDHITITKDFKLVNWFSDLSAFVTKQQAKYFLRDFFSPAEGPFVHSMSAPDIRKYFGDIVAKHNAEVTAGLVDSAEPVLPKSRQQKSDKLAAQAHAALAKHRADKSRKMQIAL